MTAATTSPERWQEPTAADLAAIDAEWPAIAADLAAVDQLIARLTAIDTDPTDPPARPAGPALPVLPVGDVRRAA